MTKANALSIDADTTRAKILENLDPSDFRWSVPFMRAGYAGRGLVYLVVAGAALWSLWHGGEAEGTKSTMERMSGGVGVVLVVLIAAGMFAYAIWRMIDSFWDLEAYGTNAKGILARIAMVVTGLIHGGIGVIALAALGAASSGSNGKVMLSELMQTTTGVYLIGGAGVLTAGTGIYYLYKAITQSYREHLQANPFTLHWNPLLRVGLAAQGLTVLIIGGLIIFAAYHADASKAGGMGTAFDWVQDQFYGRILVTFLCLGLLGFSLFCFVNAIYRIIPKAADDSVQSIASRLRQKASDAMS